MEEYGVLFKSLQHRTQDSPSSRANLYMAVLKQKLPLSEVGYDSVNPI